MKGPIQELTNRHEAGRIFARAFSDGRVIATRTLYDEPGYVDCIELQIARHGYLSTSLVKFQPFSFKTLVDLWNQKPRAEASLRELGHLMLSKVTTVLRCMSSNVSALIIPKVIDNVNVLSRAAHPVRSFRQQT
jgi:hypothetical protein